MGQVDVDQADASSLPLSGRMVGFAVASLSISITTLIFTFISFSTFRHSWQTTRDQIVAAPKIDRNNAAIALRMAARTAEIQNAAVARSNLPPPRPLTCAEAAQVVALAQSQLTAMLSPAQVQALTTELRKPDQRLVDPALPISTSRSAVRGQPPFQVVLADTGGRGPGQSIRFETLRSYKTRDDREGASVYVGVKGEVSISTTSAAERVRLVSRGSSLPSTSSYIPQWENEAKEDVRFACASAVEFVVAMALFFAGIKVLGGNRRWPLYQRLFAWSQLGVLVIMALSWCATGAGRITDDTLSTSLLAIAGLYSAVILFTSPRGTHPIGVAREVFKGS